MNDFFHKSNHLYLLSITAITIKDKIATQYNQWTLNEIEKNSMIPSLGERACIRGLEDT